MARAHSNRLIHAKSPYLLQHAHNPVDWYAWGEEAFEAAHQEDKPVFLSIGYASCHWCHVMERESFQNEALADLMNRTCINIKVDREELPEVDALYIDFAQSMMAGAVGWPLNLFLTPHLEPFFAITYLPPVAQHGLVGLTELLERIDVMWHSPEREQIELQAEQLVDAFAEAVHTKGDSLPPPEQVDQAVEALFQLADPAYGGLRGAPKFPVGHQYDFLLRYAAVRQEHRALFFTERTLDMMARGGIFDQLGGGFSRYSVDEAWRIPHFEKMLYDNALLADAYVNGWRWTKQPVYKQIASSTLDYLLRDMRHPGGAFFSSEDADSEGKEGFFYTWSFQEWKAVFEEEFPLIASFYNVSEKGNFEGRNVLYLSVREEEFARRHGIEVEPFVQQLAQAKDRLLAQRKKRTRPFQDDKILTSWNGLVVHALVEAGVAFGETRYLQAARQALFFIRNHLFEKGTLWRVWREGEACHPANLEDYASLIRALITVFKRWGNVRDLAWAIELTAQVEAHFKSPQGAFFQSNGEDTSLLVRKCIFSDGAEPSGNALHTENLLRLYQITGEQGYLRQAEDVLCAVHKLLKNYPPGYLYHVGNLLRYYDRQAVLFVVALNQSREGEKMLQDLFAKNFFFHAEIAWHWQGESFEVGGLSNYLPREGKTTLYICTAGRCLEPITEFSQMKESILDYAAHVIH